VFAKRRVAVLEVRVGPHLLQGLGQKIARRNVGEPRPGIGRIGKLADRKGVCAEVYGKKKKNSANSHRKKKKKKKKKKKTAAGPPPSLQLFFKKKLNMPNRISTSKPMYPADMKQGHAPIARSFSAMKRRDCLKKTEILTRIW
jgi:hypothetical protein